METRMSGLAMKFQPALNWTTHVSQEFTATLMKLSAPATTIAHRHGDQLGVLLTPAAVVAFVLAAWRLGADLGWTGEFAIGAGLFSHWLVWLAIGVGLQFCASILQRQSREYPSGDPK